MDESFDQHLVTSELKDPICHSNECQIGSFSSEVTDGNYRYILYKLWSDVM